MVSTFGPRPAVSGNHQSTILHQTPRFGGGAETGVDSLALAVRAASVEADSTA